MFYASKIYFMNNEEKKEIQFASTFIEGGWGFMSFSKFKKKVMNKFKKFKV
jgi:hypothetical protein